MVALHALLAAVNCRNSASNSAEDLTCMHHMGRYLIRMAQDGAEVQDLSHKTSSTRLSLSSSRRMVRERCLACHVSFAHDGELWMKTLQPVAVATDSSSAE